jgi:hypothetical protein
MAVLLIVAVIVLQPLAEKSKTYHVGFTGVVPPGTAAALAVQAKAVDHQLETTGYAPSPTGEHAVRDKKVDVLLIDGTRLKWRSKSDRPLPPPSRMQCRPSTSASKPTSSASPLTSSGSCSSR